MAYLATMIFEMALMTVGVLALLMVIPLADRADQIGADAALPLQVRQAAQGQLHGRYVIDDSGMLIFGTSLNSFGRKQSFVIRAGVDVRASVAGAFDAVWNVSPRFT